ncbi:MAG: hypothetical protein ACW99U_09795 [Candidatus Thorarchaeota archaeon]|jgi:hypothetical protein
MRYEDEENEDDLEEYEESEEDDTDEDEEESEVVTRTYDTGPTVSRMETFIDDPWPPLTFILTLIGLGIVLLTPPPLWAAASYLILGNYVLVIVAGVVTSLVIGVWKQETLSKMRLAAPPVLVLTYGCVAVGTLDTMAWIQNGIGLVAEWGVPIVTLCITIALFGVYSLFVVRRTIKGEGSK